MYSCDDTPKGGLPHSDIHGSKPARGSPWLFAACHVLHRLLVPRHPPNALLILRSQMIPADHPTMHGNHRQTRTRLSPQSSSRTVPRGSQSLCAPGQGYDQNTRHRTHRMIPSSRTTNGSTHTPLNPHRPAMGIHRHALTHDTEFSRSDIGWNDGANHGRTHRLPHASRDAPEPDSH